MLSRVDESFAGLPMWRSVYRPAEPVGRRRCAELARELYAGGRPAREPRARRRRSGSGAPGGGVLRLALPLVTRAEVDLARNGDELVVTVGSYRRLLTLPSGLARYRVAGARVEEGELQVRFVEDPEDEAGR